MEPYFQRKLVINNREMVYKGIFHHDELFRTITKALEEKGYTKREKKTEELVVEEGKRSYLELRPFKDLNNYCRLMIKIKILLDKVEEQFENKEKGREKFEKGEITIIFDAWVLTDYEARWGMKPWFYFVKGVIDKFIYRFPYEQTFSEIVAEDTAYVYAQIKKLFISYAPPEKQKFNEAEIIKRANEELGVKEIGKEEEE